MLHLRMAKVVFLMFIVAVIVNAKESADTQAKCECGVFKSPTAETTDKIPVASKAPQFNFECDADGKKSCLNMCVALAGASREDGPKKLCEIIQNASEPFVPLIYYRACKDTTWTYTGLKPTLEVCCNNNQVIPCS